MATTDFCDGDYLGAYRRFLEHFVANVCREDQLPVKMSRRDVRECELAGDIADITLQHLNQRICPPSLQAYLVKLVKEEFNVMFQKQPEECGYRPQSKAFTPLKLMQVVTSKVNEICQRYLDNSRLALLPPPPSIPLPLVSSHAIKNRRRKMEDRSVVLHDLHTMFSIKNDAVVNYYAVFDGHGGQEAATYSAAHLHQYLLESRHYPHDLELALRDAFRTTDARFLECDDTKNSGATAVCCVVYNKTLYVAWAGDSQAALIKNGGGMNLTVPHTPERPDEKSRIEKLGGEVIYYGTWRVNGVLNVSRSIGDSSFKPYVTEEPEIAKIQLDGTEDFLIIACDGFWEKATEEIVASLLYEYVSSNHSDYNSASEALVLWAKQNLSEDNISVIVVFLTPATEIRAKHFYNPRPSVAMEPPQSEQQLLDSQPFDFGFVAAKTNGNAIDNNEDPYAAASLLEPMNGRHRPKPPKYNDDDDDDDEEEEDDLGPETNVDVESHGDFGKLDQAMGQNYPDEFLIKMLTAVEVETREDHLMEEFQIDNKQSQLVAEADNVADSEESEDEWNYYRPEDKRSESSSKPDRCEEERDVCSPLEPRPIQQSPEPAAALVAEDDIEEARPRSSSGTDDVTAEYDEIHESRVAEEEREPATLLLIEPSTLDSEQIEVEPEVAAAVAALPEDAAPELKLQPEHEPFEQQEEDEDMESSHLNPDAQEFVPSSPGSPPPSMASQQLTQMSSDLVAGSPLKQNQRALKNRQIPSEEEFQEEICRRPSEIDDEVAAAAADFSYASEASPVSNNQTSASLFGGFEDERQKTVLSALNLDESEVSSTKAEFGDESSYSVASEFYKTGVDCSYTGSERGFEFDAMATSMTPSDFRQAFEQQEEPEQEEEEEEEEEEKQLDLNKVHELKDEDLLGVNEVQNGVHEEEVKQPEIEPKVPFVDEFMKDVESFEELEQQQNVRVEAFSAMVEERVSTYDNDDLLMNMRNAEQSKDELLPQQQELEQEPEVTTFSNPFTTVDAIQNLTEEMKKVDLELDMEVDEKPQQNAAPVMMNPLDLNFGGAPVEPKSDEAIIVSPVKEPEIMSSKFEEENLISRSTEALAMRDEFKTESTVEAFADEPNHVDDFDPLNEQLATKVDMVEDVIGDVVEKMHVEMEHEVKPINLSESLQEFTGLEEQLSPQSHEVKDNMCFEEVAPTLKESLVDEPKDVEEPPVVPPAAEVKDDVPLLSNEAPETVTAPVAAVAATAAAAAAVTTAVAAAAAAAAAATKTSKPSATKPAAKPTGTSKVGAKTSPTSPAKPGVATKAPALAAKKAPLAAAPKTKPAPAAASKTAASSLTRTAAATGKATTTAAKTATGTAAKPAPRTGTAPAAPKPKLGGVASKIGSLSADKKPTANGDVKPAAAKPTPSARSLSKPAPSSTAPKSSLVKTSTSSRASMGGTGSAAPPKNRPASSATVKPPTSATSRLSTSGVSSSTPARPKTAPVIGTSAAAAAAKSKIGTKSPMIDKQIKETANKQISSARTAAASKPRPTGTATSTTTTKRMSLAPKPNASPAKRPLNSAATKTAAKTSITSKVNSKVSSTTKTSANGNAAPKKEVVQNGICQSDESKISTTTTTTTNIEEDIPMKDVSPIEQVTDNQLIITAE